MIFVTHDQVEAMTLADRIVVLNGGKIEQIGTPLEIYNTPATAFVAAFVGSPRINLLPVQMNAPMRLAQVRLGCGAVVDTAVPGAGLDGGEGLQLGVRPEAIRVGAVEAGAIVATTEVVERLGDRTFVHAALSDGAMVVAEAPGNSRVKVGETVGLTIDGQAAHLFDAGGRGHHAEVGDV